MCSSDVRDMVYTVGLCWRTAIRADDKWYQAARFAVSRQSGERSGSMVWVDRATCKPLRGIENFYTCLCNQYERAPHTLRGAHRCLASRWSSAIVVGRRVACCAATGMLCPSRRAIGGRPPHIGVTGGKALQNIGMRRNTPEHHLSF